METKIFKLGEKNYLLKVDDKNFEEKTIEFQGLYQKVVSDNKRLLTQEQALILIVFYLLEEGICNQKKISSLLEIISD